METAGTRTWPVYHVDTWIFFTASFELNCSRSIYSETMKQGRGGLTEKETLKEQLILTTHIKIKCTPFE